MEYELTYIKDAKASDLRDTLKKATSVEFVVKAVGANYAFRSRHIFSQQAQKFYQLVSDVYGNIKHQKEKLEQMNKELEPKKHPDNWLEEDIDLMTIYGSKAEEK